MSFSTRLAVINSQRELGDYEAKFCKTSHHHHHDLSVEVIGVD